MLSSFATRLWQLILTQGVCYGIAGCWLYYPIFLYLDERFVRRKAFAYGIMWAGSGTGGLVSPFIIEWGLTKYGAPAFLRGWAVAMLLVMGPLLLFVRPRLPIARSSNRNLGTTLRMMKAGFGFVKTTEFWTLQTGNTLQGLGFFIPLLYLPSKSLRNGLSLITLTISSVRIKSRPFPFRCLPPSRSSLALHGLRHPLPYHLVRPLRLSLHHSRYLDRRLCSCEPSPLGPRRVILGPTRLLRPCLRLLRWRLHSGLCCHCKRITTCYVCARQPGWCRHWCYIRAARCRKRSRQCDLWAIERCTSARQYWNLWQWFWTARHIHGSHCCSGSRMYECEMDREAEYKLVCTFEFKDISKVIV